MCLMLICGHLIKYNFVGKMNSCMNSGGQSVFMTTSPRVQVPTLMNALEMCFVAVRSNKMQNDEK